MKSREDRLAEWKQRRVTKPLSNLSNLGKRGSNPAARPEDRKGKAKAPLPSRSVTTQPGANKENHSTREAHPAPARRPLTRTPKQLAVRVPRRRRSVVDLDATQTWAASMENQFGALKGRLDTLKQDSLRPSTRSDGTRDVTDTVDLRAGEPFGDASAGVNAQPDSIAARLQAHSTLRKRL